MLGSPGGGVCAGPRGCARHHRGASGAVPGCVGAGEQGGWGHLSPLCGWVAEAVGLGDPPGGGYRAVRGFDLCGDRADSGGPRGRGRRIDLAGGVPGGLPDHPGRACPQPRDGAGLAEVAVDDRGAGGGGVPAVGGPEAALPRTPPAGLPSR